MVSEKPPICDFCSATPVVREYPTADFRATIIGLDEHERPAETVNWGSLGSWLACSACAELIDADRQPELTLRVARIFFERQRPSVPGLTEAVLAQAIEPLHREFWQRRSGPARSL